MSDEDMKAELERLRAENAALKDKSQKSVYLKVSEKGGVSVYGLGRFPVTLYQEQWIRLLDLETDIREFIQLHEAELKVKEKK
jgi:ABC-type Fe3+-hydroxamate transport system substrate-binding protein